MRLIFLDIDGVLNDSYHSESLILRSCARHFNRIVRETGAKVVISSSWRVWIHGGLMAELGFGRLLRTHGIACQVARVTPPDGKVQGRGRQITTWLTENGPVAAYVVLDDDAVQGHPLVRTDGTKGLTEQDADRAIELLTTDSPTSAEV